MANRPTQIPTSQNTFWIDIAVFLSIQCLSGYLLIAPKVCESDANSNKVLNDEL